jgi:hypothetical protein
MINNTRRQNSFSRRDFLKLTGAAVFSLLPLSSGTLQKLSGEFQQPDLPGFGRILTSSAKLFDSPKSSAKEVGKLTRDQILPVLDSAIGEKDLSKNPLWYKVKGGYIPAGSIQPVEARLNPAHRQIPEGGRLAEVTVPYTDAFRKPDHSSSVTYRLYYGSTYWVKTSETDADGNIWYSFVDEKWGRIHYANATHFHLCTEMELEPISPEIPNDLKRIEVNLADQVLTAFEKETPVLLVKVSTGAHYRDGDFSTPSGHYITNRKRPTRHMASYIPSSTSNYDLPGVPWVTYLTKAGVSFHGTYWHNDYGRPRSHGCINMTPDAARWLYRWTLPAVPINQRFIAEDYGTAVDIYES